MLRHDDKEKAYRKAYPDAKSDKAIESSVNRLLKNPEVKQAIEEPRQRMRADLEAELKEQMKGELLSFYEGQLQLTKIIRGEYTTQKQVNIKGVLETIEVKPTVGNVLTALNMFFKLNNHYPQKKTAAQLKAEEQEHKAAIAKKWEPDPELKRIMEKAAANPYRHPWGDIYPPEYRGPWYDPNDPNTREQFLAITEPYRLSKLNRDATDSSDCPEKHNNSQQNTTTATPLPSLRGTKQSGPNTAKSNEGLDCHIAEPSRNDVNLEKAQHLSRSKRENTTENNNTGSSFPVLREGGPQGRKGYAQHEQENTTTVPQQAGENNNSQQHLSPLGIQQIYQNEMPGGAGGGETLEEQIATKYKHVSKKVRQMLLRDALRKEGWQTIEDAFYMVNDVYLRNQHSGTIKMMKLFEKAKNARNYPQHLREPIEKETGWTFHPKYPNMMRRTRALGW